MVGVCAERYQAERLYQHDQVEVSVPTGHPMAAGDLVVLVAPGDDAPVVFGLARVLTPPYQVDRVPDDPDDADPEGPSAAVVTYLRRRLDVPVPAATLDLVDEAESAAHAPVRLADEVYQRVADAVGPGPDPVVPQPEWMVSLDLPIEASSPAEAVRIFWTYVRQLGPRELPAFVWPRGDETAMRPYVLGEEHEMDPEEEDE
ncbi:hypothetical protein [Actinocatenispora rupis]|nr:hypothetical protein [Actinocatenispora rupis]